MRFVNMEGYKIIGGLLLYCLIDVACTTTTDSPKNKKPEARIDSYDDILRPPPPPPNLSHLRQSFPMQNQRFQRQNMQFRPPYMMRNPVFSSYERYPPMMPFRPTEAPSFLQKVSGWLFSSDNNKKTYNPPLNVPPSQYAAPSSGYGVPSSNSPPIYGVPSSHAPPAKLQHSSKQTGPAKKKECNSCNYFPWIPVIRYQTPNNHGYPAKQNLADQSNTYLPPKQNILDDLSGPPTTAVGKPFSSLSKIPVTSDPINSNPITNSYGTPISTYGPPLPITNDGESPVLIPNRKPSFNYEFNDNDNSYYNNDHIENLESNNVPLLTKPNPKDHPLFDGKKLNSNVNNDEPFRGFSNTNSDSGRGVHVLQPIPFPNLSALPIPPIFNARPFINSNNSIKTNNYAKPFTTNGHSSPNTIVNSIVSSSGLQSISNVQLIPSVPIAEYTASVDYPINIIQSPLLEIDASSSSSSNESDLKNNLKNNPIVVQNESYPHDSYSAASGGNDYSNELEKDKEFQFLPTPISAIDSKPIKDTFRPPISYSFIDQTFSKYPIASSTPSNFISEQSTNNLESNTHNIYKTDLSDSLQLYLKPSAPNKDSKIFRDNQSQAATNVNNSTNAFRYLENGFVNGRWPPPSTENPTKKPKTIQIIIPYTSNNQPSPFKFSSNDIASSAGWVPVIKDVVRNYGRKIPPESSPINNLHTTNSLIDYHESSESKIVSSSAPSYNTTTVRSVSYKPIQRVKAPEPLIDNSNSRLSLDMKKLQQNIDDWTVQEFSKIYKRQQKASTTSHLKRSKKIPDEYFTTTPSQKKVTKLSFKINELNSSLLDNEGANTIQSDYNKSTSAKASYDTWRTQKYGRNTEYTTISPKTTTRHSWEQVQTSISPLTKEKVYVVTPQPLNDSSSFKDLSFKSPRFLVRPTPGPTGSQKEVLDGKSSWKTSFNWLQSINNLEEATTESWSSKSHFGLSTLNAYTPPDGTSVHTYSGHSKVATAVTASSASKSSSQ